MKSIGIITFHASLNCGSMLQAYALQRVLKEQMGTKSEIINFSNKGQREAYATFHKFRSIKNILGWGLRLLFLPLLKRMEHDYALFQKEYLKIGKDFYKENAELKAINGKYNCFICGSDQVWNTRAVDADDAYYLNFVTKGRKIAYATSLGATDVTENPMEKKHIQSLLASFDAISVREHNAKNIIERIYPHEVPILLDPTLLLNKEDYEPLIGEPLIKGKYIFYYAMNYTHNVNLIVNKIAKKYDMPVVIIDAKAWGPLRKFTYGFKLSPQFGPLAYLNLVKYASMILTTSFHGTAFSVIFEKPFWYIDSHIRNPKDDRATSLMGLLGVLDRLQKEKYLMDNDCLTKPKYEEVKPRIDELKKESIQYLKQQLDL